MREFNVDRWGKWDTLTPREKLVVAKVIRKGLTKMGSPSFWPEWALQVIDKLDLHDIITYEDQQIFERIMNER